jgi:hypothetical protein
MLNIRMSRTPIEGSSEGLISHFCFEYPSLHLQVVWGGVYVGIFMGLPWSLIFCSKQDQHTKSSLHLCCSQQPAHTRVKQSSFKKSVNRNSSWKERIEHMR